MTIPVLPTPAPSRTQSQDVFEAAVDAFVAALPDTVDAINTTVGEMSAIAASAALGTTATSTTSRTIGTGAKTFTTQSGKGFVAGQYVIAASIAAPGTNYMVGTVTSYSGSTLEVEVTYVGGSGTLNDWSISVSALLTLASNLTVSTSSGDAITINNTGTGNCLVVNDVAGDTTPTVIDAAGRIINGHTTPIAGAGTIQRNVQNIGISGAAGITNAVFNSTTTANSQLEFAKSASDTLGAHTVVSDGEALGEVRWSGSDGTAFIRAASITAQVDGTPGTSNMPGRLIFSTTAAGGTAPTEALRIDSSQRTLMKAAHAVAPLFTNPATGTTVTLTNTVSHWQKVGASTIAALTINLPANPVDGQISSGGSRATITTLTVGSAGTATVVGAPTTLAASGYYEMIYEASTDIWYRKG